ncbi:MAG: zinc-finger domain-containing protein [Alphaproteobacteria bacterium]|nr:MAG: zinc-finger domain-containing protein [Alphaproteobacteria bacterium]
MNQAHADNPDIIEVEDHKVSCDGGGGALGHPRVWLEMGEDHKVTCPYCDREFVLKSATAQKSA